MNKSFSFIYKRKNIVPNIVKKRKRNKKYLYLIFDTNNIANEIIKYIKTEPVSGSKNVNNDGIRVIKSTCSINNISSL